MVDADRALRWLRVVTGILAAVPFVLGGLVVLLALRTLTSPADLIVAGLACLPALAASVVRGRLLWLGAALPQLREEFRRIAVQDRGGDDGGPGDAAREVDAAADRLDAEVPTGRTGRARVTLRRVWEASHWLRSPATRAGEVAQDNLGPRASATVATSTGAAERVVGLVPLTVVAAVGSLLLVVAAIVLTLGALAP